MSGNNSVHIGMITWDYDPPIGGMGRHVQSLVSGLRAAGYHVSVFSRRDLPLPFGRSILFSFLLPLFLGTFIRKNQPDLLHLHAGPGGVFLLMRPQYLPLIVTANHTYRDQVRYAGQQWKRLLIPFERRTYRLADRIVCLSPDTARSLVHDYGIDQKKLTVIGCGMNVAAFASCNLPLAKRTRHCVFVGRPDYRKGFDLLLAAWHIVHKKMPDVQLHVVGVAGESTDSIFFHHSCSDAELAALLGSSRMTVCPSRLEGFGLVAAESIASGTPVIATDVSGLRFVVTNQKTGLLTELDPESIASAILLLLTDDVLWEALHEGCRQQREELDTVLEIKKHCDLYLRYTVCQ